LLLSLPGFLLLVTYLDVVLTAPASKPQLNPCVSLKRPKKNAIQQCHIPDSLAQTNGAFGQLIQPEAVQVTPAWLTSHTLTGTGQTTKTALASEENTKTN